MLMSRNNELSYLKLSLRWNSFSRRLDDLNLFLEGLDVIIIQIDR